MRLSPLRVVALLVVVAGLSASLTWYVTHRALTPTWEPIPAPRAEDGGRQEAAEPVKAAAAPPALTVIASRPGAAPEEIEAEVTRPIEEAVRGLEGVTAVRSRTTPGTCLVTITLDPARDLDIAMMDVQNAASIVRTTLPPDADPVIITKVNPHHLPVLWLVLHGDRPPGELSDLAEKARTELHTIPGVGDVVFAGRRTPVVRILLDPNRLAALGLSASEVVEAIEKQNVELPAGFLRSGRVEFGLRTTREPFSPDDLQKMVIAYRKDQPILLGDVATVERGHESPEGMARFNRKPAVALGVRPTAWADSLTVIAAVKKELPRLHKLLPEGVGLEVAFDYAACRGPEGPDRGQTLVLDVSGTPGLSMERFGETLGQVEEAVASLKDPGTGKPLVADTWSVASVDSGARLEGGLVYLRLAPPGDRSGNVEEEAREVRKRLGELAGVRVGLLDLCGQGLPLRRRYPVEVTLLGPDLGPLAEWARRVEADLAAGGAVTDVLSDHRPSLPEVRGRIDREKAAALGVTVRDVAETLQLATGGRQLARGSLFDRRPDVRVYLGRTERKGPEDLAGVVLRAPDGKRVPMSDVARLEQVAVVPVIHRFDGRRGVTITANPAAGVPEAKAKAAAREAAERARKGMGLSEAYRVAEP